MLPNGHVPVTARLRRPLALLGPARTLATATIVRRGALLGALAFAERVLTAATAWVLFTRSLDLKVVICASLGGVLALRTMLRQALASRTEADLVGRVIGSVLDGNVLQVSVLPSEDAQADLGQGTYLSARMLSDVLPALVADVVAVVLLAVVVVAIEPARLVLGAMAATAFAAIAVSWSYGHLHRAVQASWNIRDRVIDKLVDALEGRLEIVASGERATFAAGVSPLVRAWASASVQAAAAAAMSGRVPLVAIASGAAVVVAADSAWLLSLPAKLVDLALLASITPAFAGVAQGIVGLVQTEHMARVVSQVVEGARPTRTGAPPPPDPFPIAFTDVSFRYDDAAADVLSDVTFAWGEERIIAITGANGSGKSTCLRLLLALGQPREGAIRVGGVDLSELDADAWRKRIAFLPQRPYLPMRTDVRAAVHLLAPEASDARIEGALGRVGVLEALQQMRTDPLGVAVDTLSVGQRQRIALARLLCRDACLFVLDEPDANLDRDGIALVAELARELSKVGRVILAAHTTELLEVASRVIALNGGKVVRDTRAA